MQEQRNGCAVCNIVATLRCCGCQAVYYCTKKHQKSHWKTHSKACRAYKLVENSQLGRHLVATRNIKVGEVVVYDKAPLITQPDNQKARKKRAPIPSFSEQSENEKGFMLETFAEPVCLSCYVDLKGNAAKPCIKCGWPLCDKCTKHGTECEFTIKHRGTKVNFLKAEYGQYNAAYEIIGVIRALALREHDPKAYQKLMNLQDYAAGADEKIINLKESVETAARFTKTFLNIEDVEVAEICKIIRITLVNAFKINLTQPGYSAVYDGASYIEHDCRPNCSKSFTAEEGIVFWAAVPISKGDHISTSYVNPRWGTKRRRQALTFTKFFECTCKRCTDPTEFGTMFNAIKCPIPYCTGYALPPTFLVTRGNYGDFVCRKCKKVVPRQWSEWIETTTDLARAALESNIIQCEIFIETCREYLHECNAYIFDVEIELTFAILCEAENLRYKPEEYWRKVVELCAKLTDRLRILAPAEHVTRAAILYLKFQADMMTNRMKWMTIDEKIQCAKMFRRNLHQAEELLRREPAGLRFEYSLLVSVRMAITKLQGVENELMAISFQDPMQQFLDCVLQ